MQPAFPDNWGQEEEWMTAPEVFDMTAQEPDEELTEELIMEPPPSAAAAAAEVPEDPLQHLAPSLGALLQHPGANEETARLVRALLRHVQGEGSPEAEEAEGNQP